MSKNKWLQLNRGYCIAIKVSGYQAVQGCINALWCPCPDGQKQTDR